MIHSAWTSMAGNAEQLDHVARELRVVDQSLAGIYATPTGKPLHQIEEWLAAETWFDAEGAKAAGLVDEVAPAEEAARRNATPKEILAWMERRLAGTRARRTTAAAARRGLHGTPT